MLLFGFARRYGGLRGLSGRHPRGRRSARSLAASASIFLRISALTTSGSRTGSGSGSSWAPPARCSRQAFHTGEIAAVRDKMLDFWTLFRRECSAFPSTRGTNLSTGMDLASDGVPLRSIYREIRHGAAELAWAALDGDSASNWSVICPRSPESGTGTRSAIPRSWWLNSPGWTVTAANLDIYLPMSVARRGGHRKPRPDGHPVSYHRQLLRRCRSGALTRSFRILRGRADSPDQPGPSCGCIPSTVPRHDLRDAPA